MCQAAWAFFWLFIPLILIGAWYLIYICLELETWIELHKKKETWIDKMLTLCEHGFYNTVDDWHCYSEWTSYPYKLQLHDAFRNSKISLNIISIIRSFFIKLQIIILFINWYVWNLKTLLKNLEYKAFKTIITKICINYENT